MLTSLFKRPKEANPVSATRGVNSSNSHKYSNFLKIVDTDYGKTPPSGFLPIQPTAKSTKYLGIRPPSRSNSNVYFSLLAAFCTSGYLRAPPVEKGRGRVGVPVVEGQIVLHQCGQDGNLILGTVVEDLLGECSLVHISAISAQLLVHEALLRGSELTTGNGRVVRSECPIELDVVASNRVIQVIQNRFNSLWQHCRPCLVSSRSGSMDYSRGNCSWDS